MKCVPVSIVGVGWISWGRQMDNSLKKAMQTSSTRVCEPICGMVLDRMLVGLEEMYKH